MEDGDLSSSSIENETPKAKQPIEQKTANYQGESYSVKGYYKRPIEPWPMPCSDGTHIITLQDRTTLIRDPETQSTQEQEVVSDSDSIPKNPYRPEDKQALPTNNGFPRYAMVKRKIWVTMVTCVDRNGNSYQLAPGPKYNPFE